MEALIILFLAWALGDIVTELCTAQFLAGALGAWLPVGLLPLTSMLLSMLVSFGIGSAWGTMGVLIPLVAPLAWDLSGHDLGVLRASLGAVMGGAVFGNVSSPLADTSVLSSMVRLTARTHTPRPASTGMARSPPLRASLPGVSVRDDRTPHLPIDLHRTHGGARDPPWRIARRARSLPHRRGPRHLNARAGGVAARRARVVEAVRPPRQGSAEGAAGAVSGARRQRAVEARGVISVVREIYFFWLIKRRSPLPRDNRPRVASPPSLHGA